MCKIVFQNQEPIAAKHLFSSSNPSIFLASGGGSTHPSSQARLMTKKSQFPLSLHSAWVHNRREVEFISGRHRHVTVKKVC